MNADRIRAGRWPLLLLWLLPLAGACAGDPDVDGAAAPLALDLRIERARWEHAPPGCEDVSGEGLRLAACDGEPTLGALVDYDGRVRCIDAIRVLVLEAQSTSAIAPLANDPSPQPNRPPPPDMKTPTPASST